MLYFYIFLDHRLHNYYFATNGAFEDGNGEAIISRYMSISPQRTRFVYCEHAQCFLLSSEIQGILLPSHPVTCVHHVSDRNLPTSNIKTYIFSYYQ